MKPRIGLLAWLGLLAALPLQIRTVVGGWQGEWSSFFLYGTDFLLVLLLIIDRSWWQRLRSFPGRWLLGGLLALAVGSLAVTTNMTGGVFRVTLLAKGILVAALAAVWFRRAPQWSFAALAGGALAQALIGIGQFMIQRDLGLRLLGETVLSPAMAGVATAMQNGVAYLRVYGATPHPNVLAAVLVAGLVAAWAGLPGLWRRRGWRRWCLVLAVALMVLALLITFSRIGMAMVVGSIVLLAGWQLFERRWSLQARALGIGLLLLIVFMGMLWPWWQERLTVGADEQSVSLRLLYQKKALTMIEMHPLIGVGIGDNTVALEEHLHTMEPWMIQPVHSLYLLFAAEMGVGALLLFGGFLIAVLHHLWHRWPQRVRERRYGIALVVTLLVLLGAATGDHFIATTQQGMLLLWMTVGGLVAVAEGVVTR